MVKKNQKNKVKPLLLDTLLSVLEKSIGTKMFQTIWAEVDGRKIDITEKGNLSCALFVSSILAMFDLVDKVHTTVSGTVKAMEKSGWRSTKKLTPGVVIVWGKSQDVSFDHQHIGFYLGDNVAISNNSKKKTPIKHHVTFGRTGQKGYRSIAAIYKHPSLNKK